MDRDDLDFNQPRTSRRGSNDISKFEGEVISVDMDLMAPEEDRRTAMLVLAEEGGAAEAAAKRLSAEHRIYVSAEDLVRWRDKKFPTVWVEVHSEYQQRIEKELEARTRENAIRSARASARLLDRIDEHIDSAGGIDAAKMLDSVTKAGAASTTQTLQISGRPVDGRAVSMDEIERVLIRSGVVSFVDSSAEDDTPDAEVVPAVDAPRSGEDGE